MMWEVIDVLASFGALCVVFFVLQDAEGAAERAGRIAAAFRRGYRARLDAPPADKKD